MAARSPFGVGETKAPPTQALLEHAVLLLEILDHVQLMAVDPTGEHQEEQLKRQKHGRHCSRVYRPLRRPAPLQPRRSAKYRRPNIWTLRRLNSAQQSEIATPA
jgi:hypothetical protein